MYGRMIDLKQAFDTVSQERLLQKFEHCGVRGVELQLLKSYLTNRKHDVNMNKAISSQKPVSLLVP